MQVHGVLICALSQLRSVFPFRQVLLLHEELLAVLTNERLLLLDLLERDLANALLGCASSLFSHFPL